MNPTKFYASTSWAKAMATLPDQVRLEVYDALFAFAESGETPEISVAAAAAFAFIRTDVEIENERLQARNDRNRAAVMKRWAKEKKTKRD